MEFCGSFSGTVIAIKLTHRRPRPGRRAARFDICFVSVRRTRSEWFLCFASLVETFFSFWGISQGPFD